MLRTAVLLFAIVMTAVGAWLTLRGLAAPGVYLLILGLLVILGTLFERWRYRNDAQPPAANWQATGERFVDPSSGKDVEVLYDPVSGERRYVER